MRIEIVNERLLPRFGVDRLLVLLGQHLVKQGHELGFTSLRCDQRLLSGLGESVTIDLPEGLDMQASEREVARAMRLRLQERRPDALICGGWPFFRAAREAGSQGVASLFIDAGAVAQDGMPDTLVNMQRELRRVRQTELPGIDRIVPISRFIRDSQTLPDRGHSKGVRTVLLGGDHMQRGLFLAGDTDAAGATLLGRLRQLRASGVALILVLGRFESFGYKNAPATYDMLRIIRVAIPHARLLILDAGADCAIPPDLASAVMPLGQPDDATLQGVMELCSLGLSPSLWEGFNLPIVEMQQLNRPALAFNLGAHPEVIAHPWLLCDSTEEMARKAIRLLTGSAPAELAPAIAASAARVPWATTLTTWEAEIADAVRARRPGSGPALTHGGGTAPRTILVDVTNAAVDPANSGVMRVTRLLCARLQRQPQLRLVFARWDAWARTYRLLDPHQRQALASYGGPRDHMASLADERIHDVDGMLNAMAGGAPPLLFTPEVILDGGSEDRLAWARGHGIGTVALLHDVIPIDHPEYCDPNVVAAFPSYVATLLRYDALWSVSGYSLKRLEAYVAGCSLPRRVRSEAHWLPGQFGSAPRVQAGPAETAAQDEVHILCVCTLEPRKNHVTLLAAWQRLRQRRPDLRIRLTLIGNHYAGAPRTFEMVNQAAAADPQLKYLGVLNDTQLRAAFEACAFTVYPSLVEGFGLPIMESLWLGRPAIVHQEGVMAELAADGGCLCTDMSDPDTLSAALERMATDAGLRARLTDEAMRRRIATWEDYAAAIGQRLLAVEQSEVGHVAG